MEALIGNPATTYYYDYFNITDGEISRDHIRRELSIGLPAADGTKYSYKSWSGGNSPVTITSTTTTISPTGGELRI